MARTHHQISMVSMATAADTTAVAAAPDKWKSYYSRGVLPWDSGRVSSQLAAYISSCIQLSQPFPPGTSAAEIARQAEQGSVDDPLEAPDGPATLHICERCAAWKPPAGSRVLEIGCGTGASSVWLAQQGYDVTGVDIVPEAIEAAKGKAAAAAGEGAAAALGTSQPTFLVHDVMALPWSQRFHLIYDCQVYHALVKEAQGACLPQLLFHQLRPGGLLFMLTGNACEPEVGPSVLTAHQLVEPLLAAGFTVLHLQATRFDATNHYTNVLGKRPLAWCIILQRPLLD